MPTPSFDNGPWEGGGWERELISEGDNLAEIWNRMKLDAADINMKYEYRPEQQNSNSTVDEIIKRNSLPAPTERVGENSFPTPGNDRQLKYPLTSPAEPGLSDGPVHEYPPAPDKRDKPDSHAIIQQSSWIPNGLRVFNGAAASPNAQSFPNSVLAVGQVGMSPEQQIWIRLKSGPKQQVDLGEN
jgi:hypothetical protein